MKMLGMIGGTSWHSTIEYYRYINEAVNDRFGNNTNPPLMLYNMNQFAVHALQKSGDWDEIATLLIEGATCLEKGGARGLIFCANTPHMVFEQVSKEVEVPILHICDATSKAIHELEISKVALIGTRFTMEERFMIDRFSTNEIEAIVPESIDEVETLHRIIQTELTFGKVEVNSKRIVCGIVERMVQRGARGVVLGCTEFPLMFSAGELGIPMFNTTELHARAAVEFILDR